MRPGRGRGGWIVVLALFSATAGALARDRLPSYEVDAMHAAFGHPARWFADGMATVRGLPTGHPLPAPPNANPLPSGTAPAPASIAPSPPSLSTASAGPPEFSVSALPEAATTAAPKTARAPARAYVFPAPQHHARGVAPRTAAAAPVPVEDPPLTKTGAARVAGSASPPPANATPAPAPGSLDDLIRKEVAKEQKPR